MYGHNNSCVHIWKGISYKIELPEFECILNGSIFKDNANFEIPQKANDQIYANSFSWMFYHTEFVFSKRYLKENILLGFVQILVDFLYHIFVNWVISLHLVTCCDTTMVTFVVAWDFACELIISHDSLKTIIVRITSIALERFPSFH